MDYYKHSYPLSTLGKRHHYSLIHTITKLLFAFAFALSTLALVAGKVSFNDYTFIGNRSYTFLLSGILIAISFGFASQTKDKKIYKNYLTWQYTSALTLLFIFFSDWFSRPYALFQGPTIRGEIFVLGTLGLFLVNKGYKNSIIKSAFLLGCFLPCYFLLKETQNFPLFRDDHSVFFIA